MNNPDKPTVTDAVYEEAQILFDDILGDAGSYAEYGTRSYREAAVRTIAVVLARREQQTARSGDVGREVISDAIDQLHWINAQAENVMEATGAVMARNEDGAASLIMIDSMASDIGVNAMMLCDKLRAALTTPPATDSDREIGKGLPPLCTTPPADDVSRLRGALADVDCISRLRDELGGKIELTWLDPKKSWALFNLLSEVNSGSVAPADDGSLGEIEADMQFLRRAVCDDDPTAELLIRIDDILKLVAARQALSRGE